MPTAIPPFHFEGLYPGFRDTLDEIVADFSTLDVFSRYSTYCYFIAPLVALVLCDLGFDASPLDCMALLQLPDARSLVLGGPIVAHAGQIRGHLACEVKGFGLVDLGLGTIRKYFGLQQFPLGIACARLPSPEVLAKGQLPDGTIVEWHPGTPPPDKLAQLTAHESLIRAFHKRWRKLRRHRLPHETARA
jgi:hypothetical protein